ncbi:MAG: hypothetical protein ACLTBV_20555 [Enterocloster bolteae]
MKKRAKEVKKICGDGLLTAPYVSLFLFSAHTEMGVLGVLILFSTGQIKGYIMKQKARIYTPAILLFTQAV